MHAGRLALGLAVAAGAASCASFGSSATEDVTDASAEASVPPDGGDGGGGGEGGSGAFCSTVAGADVAFCDDFDGPSPLADWSRIDGTTPWAKYEVETTLAASPPNAARLRIDATGLASSSPDARLRRPIDPPSKHITLTGALRVELRDQAALGARVVLVRVTLNDQSSAYLLSNGTWSVNEKVDGGDNVQQGVVDHGSISDHAWHRFELDLDVPLGGLSARLDGAGARATVSLPNDAVVTNVTVGPAEPNIKPVDGWSVMFDDLVVRSVP